MTWSWLLVIFTLVLSVYSWSPKDTNDNGEYEEKFQLRDSRLHFKLWQLEHGKVYKTSREEIERFTTFQSNLKLIKQLNEQHQETVFDINQFADMSPQEFSDTVLMRRRSVPQHSKDKYLKTALPEDPLPETFDWRDHNMVSSVKDQGSAGTCWAFSTVANLEGQFAMKGHKLMNLSVEQVVDCDDSKDVPKEFGDCGVYGGWPYLAFGYLQRQGGIESESDYPYCAGVTKDACEVCPNGPWNSTICGPPMPYCNMTQSCPYRLNKSKFVEGLTVKDWKTIDSNETIIAQQLMKIGPLSIALDARMLQFYRKGVFNPFICSKTSLDHAVLMVGFGTEKGTFSSTPYWLIKNSWGPKWGLDGYFKIKRGDGTCGVNTQVTTAILA